MKTKLIVVASTLLLAAPAWAQEPAQSTEPPTVQEAPAPTPSPATEPMNNAAPAPTEAAPPASPSAAAPTPPAPTAAAEAPASGPLREAKDDTKVVPSLNATVDQVEDMSIYDANGKKIAEVDSVLEDDKGEVKGLAIEYGGFLGFGSQDAILTFDKVKSKDGNITVDLTEEDLPGLPAWKD
jgi:sporulation protein YlmC with PRC-barrel domain